jgi:hypothetical protein
LMAAGSLSEPLIRSHLPSVRGRGEALSMLRVRELGVRKENKFTEPDR